MQFRTDLAIEAREIAGENTGGIEFKKYSENGLEISRLIVKNQKARQALGKEIGTYITIELPSLTDNFTETDKRLETVGNEIKRLLPVNGLVLVAGLGNMEITPDSLGPKTSRRVLATRHIGGEIAVSYTHLRAHETKANLVCRLLLEKKNATTLAQCTLHSLGSSHPLT